MNVSDIQITINEILIENSKLLPFMIVAKKGVNNNGKI